MFEIMYSLARRLARVFVTALIVATISFVVVRIIPGDPAAIVAGMDASAERVLEIRERMGTNRPLFEQYTEWIASVLRGDFGRSLIQNRPVADMIGERLPLTLALAGSAFILTIAVSIPLGLRAAMKYRGVSDRVLDVFSHVGLAVPDFWAGIILLLVFSVYVQVFPLFGADTAAHFVLPSVALALSRAALLSRVVRGSVRAELRSGYVEGIRARGVSGGRLLWRHVLPNALLPVISVAAVQLGYLLGGVIIIEQVFSMPGLGRLILTAVFQRDFPVVQAGVMLVAIGFSLINFLADTLYVLAEPRIRSRA